VRYITLSFSMAAERREVEVKVNRDGARAELEFCPCAFSL